MQSRSKPGLVVDRFETKRADVSIRSENDNQERKTSQRSPNLLEAIPIVALLRDLAVLAKFIIIIYVLSTILADGKNTMLSCMTLFINSEKSQSYVGPAASKALCGITFDLRTELVVFLVSQILAACIFFLALLFKWLQRHPAQQIPSAAPASAPKRCFALATVGGLAVCQILAAVVCWRLYMAEAVMLSGDSDEYLTRVLATPNDMSTFLGYGKCVSVYGESAMCGDMLPCFSGSREMGWCTKTTPVEVYLLGFAIHFTYAYFHALVYQLGKTSEAWEPATVPHPTPYPIELATEPLHAGPHRPSFTEEDVRAIAQFEEIKQRVIVEWGGLLMDAAVGLKFALSGFSLIDNFMKSNPFYQSATYPLVVCTDFETRQGIAVPGGEVASLCNSFLPTDDAALVLVTGLVGGLGCLFVTSMQVRFKLCRGKGVAISYAMCGLIGCSMLFTYAAFLITATEPITHYSCMKTVPFTDPIQRVANRTEFHPEEACSGNTTAGYKESEGQLTCGGHQCGCGGCGISWPLPLFALLGSVQFGFLYMLFLAYLHRQLATLVDTQQPTGRPHAGSGLFGTHATDAGNLQYDDDDRPYSRFEC